MHYETSKTDMMVALACESGAPVYEPEPGFFPAKTNLWSQHEQAGVIQSSGDRVQSSMSKKSMS